MAAATAAERLEYVLVVDFEATCDDDRTFGPQEIIELPVVFVKMAGDGDGDGGPQIVDEFHRYIRPTSVPQLTRFCTELTGIKQETVDAGMTIDEALDGLAEKIDEVLGAELAGESTRWAFCTCGDWDLKTMLPKEVRNKELRLAPALAAGVESWINIKHVYSAATGSRARGMKGMLDAVGLELVGRHHSGIDDARNIAALLIELWE
ncbi:ERI1 exoribonuclease 3 [Thecamonas trahens ATCC 50062]|uniref:ERI1 exoribonuclease 3 n=1 Tax=Thecamonas trahens ATCC 50062 TaxID=461836 RepID=A0A0L0DAN5_THETB|nr:ERI1 exoribonuclease 3 [Thecamonas trahens ATCC 50062]KNC49419.1 ERI1 exoribonuclease 3 [Thecamonas trahens ATCC 50062]|eukprot:XP_013757843.1 ERI1 exoribonuclease 3 [Thecamonas trahens ATCC 50062]